MQFSRLEDGSLYVKDLEITISAIDFALILDRKIGRQTLVEKYGTTKYFIEKLLREIRDKYTPTASLLPSVTIEGVTPDDYKPDFDSLYEKSVKNYAKTDALATRKANQKITFTGGAVCIVHFADTHFGNSGTDVARAFREAELVRDTPGMYAAFNGDLVDNFIVGRLTTININTDTKIIDQWALGGFWLEHIGQKLLLVNGGNHDKWSYKVAGVQPLRNYVRDGILYDTDEIAVDFDVSGFVVPTLYRHQFKGYSYWNPFHPHIRAANKERPGYKLYIGAHTHTHGGYIVVPRGGELVHGVQCGTYKKFDDFAREMGFSQTGDSTAVATIIHPDGAIHHLTNLALAAFYMREIYKSQTGKIS